MLKIVPSNQFKKDLKLAKKRGLSLNHLTAVVNMLAAREPLNERYRDHALTGRYRGFRECHIHPDWLLIYKVYADRLVLALIRTGTHSDLF